MESSMKLFVLLMFITLSFSFSVSSSSPSLPPMCRPQINPIVRDLQLQCPNTIVSSPPIEVDGESLDGLLGSCKPNAYTAILFYASWCPFSRIVQPKFNALASMYPQIKHVKVEQSLALPSVFSRYGIHSVPSILIANKTARVHYHGPKDLNSLLNFYLITTGLEHAVNFTEEDQLDSSSENIKESDSVLNLYQITTGLEHAVNFTEEDQLDSSSENGNDLYQITTPGFEHAVNFTEEDQLDTLENTFHPLNLTSLKDEPYLIFSISFLLLKALVYLCPNIMSHMISLWVTYVPRLNLAIFGESRQLLTHALHLFDIKSAFSKLKISKNRNFHNGARSARVLASSFASVSLGETSSPRA